MIMVALCTLLNNSQNIKRFQIEFVMPFSIEDMFELIKALILKE